MVFLCTFLQPLVLLICRFLSFLMFLMFKYCRSALLTFQQRRKPNTWVAPSCSNESIFVLKYNSSTVRLPKNYSVFLSQNMIWNWLTKQYSTYSPGRFFSPCPPCSHSLGSGKNENFLVSQLFYAIIRGEP